MMVACQDGLTQQTNRDRGEETWVLRSEVQQLHNNIKTSSRDSKSDDCIVKRGLATETAATSVGVTKSSF